jgi:hypothetical protein
MTPEENKRELEWWEDMTLQLNKIPFPEYLKDTTGTIHKIKNYAVSIGIKALLDDNTSIPVTSTTPATEEDYLNQFPLP